MLEDVAQDNGTSVRSGKSSLRKGGRDARESPLSRCLRTSGSLQLRESESRRPGWRHIVSRSKVADPGLLVRS